MTAPLMQVPADIEGTHLVLYDGVCGLCNRLVRFVLAHDRRTVFTFTSLQGDVGRAILARYGCKVDELSTFYVLTNYRTDAAQMLGRSRAALFVARHLGWPWQLAGVMTALPTRVADGLYNLVAQHRYRMFGRTAQCFVVAPGLRRRFWEGTGPTRSAPQ
jgi:predicted DCC family thiol-disulfide oxidoreductase YuxK